MQVLENDLREEIKIHNVVCTADLGQRVAIATFNKYKHLSADLKLYNCGYVKDDSMIGRVTVFASGKLISVGTKSPKQAFLELKKAGKILKNYGLISSFKIVPNVRNIVARFDIGHSIPLEKIARIIPKAMYEPEQFPGLIYRIQNSLVSLIFSSGKCVVVGAKTINDLNRGLFEVEQWLRK